MRFSWQVYWDGSPFSLPVDHVLPELSTMICPYWVALHGMAHSFIKLQKLLCHDKVLILEWGQEATVRTLHGTTHWYRIEKGERQGCLLSLCLFNLYAKDFPGGSDGKASACNVGDRGQIPGSRRSLGEGNGNPLQ